ncbi:hypothetical protein [uncultured Gammaproteobacteria bacterium]|nr:hypothetical protein [uncultured Gammaproteobacteria bacterium]
MTKNQFPLYRKSFFPSNGLGFDSIQGLLEMTEWYHIGELQMSFDKDNKCFHDNPLYTLEQLENNGYIQIDLENRKSGSDKNLVLLKQISLTISGYELLEKLRQKSKSGAFKKRIFNMGWTIATAIFIMLITLEIKGL